MQYFNSFNNKQSKFENEKSTINRNVILLGALAGGCMGYYLIGEI